MYDKKEEARKLLKSLIDAQAKGELWSSDVMFDLFDKTYDEGYKDGKQEGAMRHYKIYPINSFDICPKCGHTKGEGL
jgi:hypothetical protein